MPTSDGGLLDAKRVAELLGISTHTLRNWVRRGFFPQPVRLGPTGRLLRWPPTDLVRYLKDRAQAGGRPEPRGPGGAGSVAVGNAESGPRSPG
jgi:predicted DNA-binding transcriptional regulator AlpA